MVAFISKTTLPKITPRLLIDFLDVIQPEPQNKIKFPSVFCKILEDLTVYLEKHEQIIYSVIQLTIQNTGEKTGKETAEGLIDFIKSYFANIQTNANDVLLEEMLNNAVR